MLTARRLLLVPLFLLVALAARAEVGTARPWIGIEIDAGQKGVLIKGVREQTPAAKAGLRAGDEVLAIDGRTVRKPEELIAEVQNRGVGTTVKLKLWRGGKELTVSLALAPRPDEAQMLRQHLIGKAAPGFVLDARVGATPASLEALAGKVVVVEFWATWCGPCRSTLPTLATWQQKYGERGLAVIGISTEPLEALEAFAQKQQGGGLGYTIASDGDAAVMQAYGVPAVPTLVIIDRAGVVRFAEVGAGDNLAAAELIFTKLLDEAPPPPGAKATKKKPRLPGQKKK